ncbi:MAG TPA: hypothetical protein VGG29_19170 [Caulobacteraceae bacterium]|jgi:hypothetical protein
MSGARSASVALALAALAGGDGAQAAGADCRRIPVLPAGCFAERGAPGARCRAIPPARAPCFMVRGRLAFYNGTPGLRLLPLGSRRIFGVLGGDGDAESATLVPKSVDRVARPSQPGAYLDVFGDFKVCPMASERARWMRPVCIVSARNVVPSLWQNNLPGGRLPTGWRQRSAAAPK